MQQMLCIHFFKRLGPQKNIFWSYGRGRQGKAFYSLQPFSCPFLVRPLVEACHFIASYNFPMSFQNLSTYPLSDPNSLLENPLQDPPPPEKEPRCPNMVCFAHFDFEMCFAPQRRALFRHLNFQKWSEHGVFCTFRLRNVLRATTACTFSTSQLPKVVRTWCVLHISTSKCASRHNGVHFFDISTSKSRPNPSVFNTFYFQMRFAPQRRALVQHLNFQKWSDAEVF